MNDDFFFKCNPAKFLAGIDRLSEAETAAYTRLIMLMYWTGGPLPDRCDEDTEWFASKLKISKRKWRTVRDGLLAKGRIRKSEDGFIRDDRVEDELAKRADERAANQANGAAGGRKSAENRAKTLRNGGENDPKTDRKSRELDGGDNENNDLEQAGLGFPAKRNAKQLESELETTQHNTARALRAGDAIDFVDGDFEEIGAAPRPPPKIRDPAAADEPPERADRLALLTACIAAAGPGLHADRRVLWDSLDHVERALDEGCDFEADVLAVIGKRTARRRTHTIATFGYFDAAFREARDARRQSPSPEKSGEAGLNTPLAPETTHERAQQNSHRRNGAGAAGQNHPGVARQTGAPRGGERGGGLVGAALRAQARRQILEGREGPLGGGDRRLDAGPECAGEHVDAAA
jgi:uncharacterized protein YdaU (DUF1376 family)